MSAHLSEEEQIEALKRWWKRNGRTIIIAVLLGVTAWMGLQQWNQKQQAQSESNSALYIQVQQLAGASSLNDEQRTELWNKSTALKEQAADTQYGWYSALTLAKLAFEKNDFDTAAVELQYVLDGAVDQALKNIAQLRLARVESARGDVAKALELLQIADAGDLAATYAEFRGDLHMKQGDTNAARIAYQEAVNSATEVDRNARDLLDLKLNRVTPANMAIEVKAESIDVENIAPASDKDVSDK